MTAALTLALSFVRTALRERTSFFWFCLFPLMLLALLGGIFGRVEQGELDLAVGLVDLDQGPLGRELARILEDGRWPLRLHAFPPGTTQVERVGQARQAVEKGELHAVLLIPEDFSSHLLGGAGDPVVVPILYRRGEAASSLAASLLEEVVEEFGRAVLAQRGRLPNPLPVGTEVVGGESRTVRYTEFVLPGVVLMALFVLGLFSVPEVVVLAKDTGILRRYFATPLSSRQYLAGATLGMALLGTIQVLAVWALGRFGFDVRLPLLRPLSLAFLFLAFATALALGLFVSAVSRDYARAMALANLLNLPLQFLGGLYFPVTSLPGPLRALMAVNPLTHLAEGWRASLGLSTSAFPLWLNVLVPLVWLVGSVLLAAQRITLLEGR
ncbi:MAG: ABC transporter permease [Candidatus Bipolaricaulaceae bacterium]